MQAYHYQREAVAEREEYSPHLFASVPSGVRRSCAKNTIFWIFCITAGTIWQTNYQIPFWVQQVDPSFFLICDFQLARNALDADNTPDDEEHRSRGKRQYLRFSEKGFPQTGQVALEYLFKQKPLLCGFSENKKDKSVLKFVGFYTEKHKNRF